MAFKRSEEFPSSKFQKRVSLKDIRYYWHNGDLKKDGKRQTEAQCVFSLQAKHKQWGNKEPLTQKELHDIIYKDRSVYRQKVSAESTAQIQLKKLEAESKLVDLMKLRKEYQIEALTKKRDNEIIRERVKEMMQDSSPQQFGVEMYQRMNPAYVVLAIQSEHPEFSSQQCRLIIGSWVRRNL